MAERGLNIKAAVKQIAFENNLRELDRAKAERMKKRGNPSPPKGEIGNPPTASGSPSLCKGGQNKGRRDDKPKQVCLLLEQDMADRAKRKAKAEGLTFSKYISKLIEGDLKDELL